MQDTYTDEGVSGAKASRPQLDALMTACRDRRVDVVVVYKTDRFSRSRAHLFTTLEELATLNVAFTSVTEAFDTSTTAGDAMVGMLAIFAQMERNLIRERTRAGVNAKVRAGGWGGGNIPPFGYRIVGQRHDTKLAIDDAEAATVRLAVSLVLDQGLSTLDTARRLNALGHTPRNALLWTSQNLRNCLCRGQWDGSWTFGKKSPKGSIPTPIVVPVEPILDADRAAALSAHLKRTTIIRGRAGVHPLSGRLYCPCGAPMTGIARGDRAHRRYRCRNSHQEPSRPWCRLPSVRAQPVDDAVWTQVLQLLTNPDLLTDLAAERLGLLEGAQAVEADVLAEAEVVVKRTQSALANAAARCLALGLDEATTAATVAELRDQYGAAIQHRSMIAEMRAGTEQAKHRVATAQELAQVARTRLVTADADLRAAVFAILDVRVQVLEHAKPLRLRVEGSVAHELLLTGVRDGVAPGVPARNGG